MTRKAVGLLAALISTCSSQWLDPLALGSANQLPSEGVYRQILNSLCPGHVVVGKDWKGCNVCPNDTLDAGQKADASIESILTGSFSGPRKNDVLAVVYGCEPHANHFVDTFLFTRSGTLWKTQKVEGPRGSCRVIPNRDGQDGLLCYEADIFTGVGSGDLYFTYAGGSRTSLLSTVLVTSPCMPNNGTGIVSNSEIKGLKFTGQTLSVKAVCSRGRKVCRNGEDVARYSPREYLIDFLFDGQSYHVAPASAAALKAYEACSKLDF